MIFSEVVDWYKRQLCTLLALSTGLFISACSLTPTQPDTGTVDLPENNQATSNAENKQSADVQPSSLDPAASVESSLLAQPNQYLLSKASLPNSIKEKAHLALTKFTEQNYQQADSHIAQVIEINPSFSSIWLLKGDIGAKLNRPTEALIHDYQQAIELNQYNYLAHNRLAILLTRQGRFEQALAHYQQAINSWPGFAEGYLNKGILLDMYMGNKQQALNNYQTYQSLITLTHGQADKKVRGWIVDLSRQLKQAG